MIANRHIRPNVAAWFLSLRAPLNQNKNTDTSMADSPETDVADTLLEYRLTTMILALVSAINGGRSDSPKFESPLEKSQSPRRRALNAFANIAVRGTEVVAVTTPDSSDDGGSSSPAATLEQFAVEEENDAKCSPCLHTITVMANTEWEDPRRDRLVTKIDTGKSKWADIMDSPWCCVPNPL
jgi:hypothetical protein